MEKNMTTEGGKLINPCQRCGKNEGTQELHSCPYQCEINDDCEDYCNCCDCCTQDCADEI